MLKNIAQLPDEYSSKTTRIAQPTKLGRILAFENIAFNKNLVQESEFKISKKPTDATFSENTSVAKALMAWQPRREVALDIKNL